MATKLQKVPHRIWLHRKVKFFSDSVICKDIELKSGMETYFRPLELKGNI